MYDSTYADAWIRNHESGKEVFRENYLAPYLKQVFQAPDVKTILDVGCGWGFALSFVRPDQQYRGIDPTQEFLDYIVAQSTHPRLSVSLGRLPDALDASDSHFDLTLCSLVLHTVPELTHSLVTLIAKTKPNGRVVVIDFCDSAEQALRTDVFRTVYGQDETRIAGIACLPSGVEVEAEVYFHKERDFEKVLTNAKKSYLGPLFVAYDFIREC
ncbi:class I SAM-dependent methyltransferase [Candidatus Woesearchaeota archaeon]|nr:class I SAM-dependent methyltransferase [Candidatus Woesearchaeota archaeon]